MQATEPATSCRFPLCGACFPIPQALHAELSREGGNVPQGQPSVLHAELALKLNARTGVVAHAVHATPGVFRFQRPAAQSRQTESTLAPTTSENVPPAQSVHCALPFAAA